jgi:hypothetical protein
MMADPYIVKALSHVNMVLAKELQSNCQRFLFELKCHFVIAELVMAYANVIIALCNFSMILT